MLVGKGRFRRRKFFQCQKTVRDRPGKGRSIWGRESGGNTVGAGGRGGKWRWSSRRDIGFRWDMVGEEGNERTQEQGSGNSNADSRRRRSRDQGGAWISQAGVTAPPPARGGGGGGPEGAGPRRQRAGPGALAPPPGTEPQTKSAGHSATRAEAGPPAGPVPCAQAGSLPRFVARSTAPALPPVPAPAPNLVDLRPGSRGLGA